MMRPQLITLTLLFAAAFSTGCNHLIYSHEGTLGIHFNIASEEKVGQLTLGYDQETFVVSPERGGENQNGQNEAMSLVSATKLDATGLNRVEYNQLVVTGNAAERAAKDEKTLEYFRSAIYPEASSN